MTLTNTNARVRMLSKIITDGETLSTQLDEPAWFEKVEGGYSFELINKEQACRTKVTIDATSVTVTHTGSVETTMVFKNGYTYRSNYGLEYGDIDMEICTDRIFVDVNNDGGSIELWYELLLGGNPSSAKMIMEIEK